MATINPYLHLHGTTRAAFEFYKSVFGGEFVMVMSFGDIPGGDEMQMTDAEKAQLAHISLPIGNQGDVLMGSDALDRFGPPHVTGNNFSISYSPDSRAEADRIFSALADGGTVIMPLADQFWGSYHGMLTDKFGIQWMVDFDERYAGK